MKVAGPVDVDELLTSCRAENARRAFGEAVAAYKAGAYRACIVVTWTAVVFDYVGKLRELEVAGNGEAMKALVEWETARRNHDVALSMRLEDQLLEDAASRFDLLTPIEWDDLKRLREDRHRCAHPSLLTLDEPYEPSAELARLHMRHAVGHLLARPPVQGKEAWDRIWADISSEYFPEDVQSAVSRIHTVLSRARPSLVRKVAVELTRRLLSRDEADAHGRIRAALQATMRLHHTEVSELYREKLPVLAAQVADDDLPLLLSFCRSVDGTWDALGVVGQGKLTLLAERTENMAVLADALAILALHDAAFARVPSLSGSALGELTKLTRRPDLLERVVCEFETSLSFSTFAALWPCLAEDVLAKLWTADQRKRLVRALSGNEELGKYGGYRYVQRSVLALCSEKPNDFKDEWRSLFDTLSPRGRLAEAIREVYTDFPAPPDERA